MLFLQFSIYYFFFFNANAVSTLNLLGFFFDPPEDWASHWGSGLANPFIHCSRAVQLHPLGPGVSFDIAFLFLFHVDYITIELIYTLFQWIFALVQYPYLAWNGKIVVSVCENLAIVRALSWVCFHRVSTNPWLPWVRSSEEASYLPLESRNWPVPCLIKR